MCEENIAPGTFWAASSQGGGDPGKSLCVACGDTPAGLACREELPYQLRHVKDFRGLNQALGLGTLDNWIPILHGQELGDDDDDDDDIDTYNEYAMVWLNVDPASSPYPIMITVADDHGRCGFVGLRLTLSELLEQLAHCGPVRYLHRQGWPIHFG